MLRDLEPADRLAMLRGVSGEGGWGEAGEPGMLASGCYKAHLGNCTSSLQPFLPSFPAEGNNLSPEQIKSDLHEI